MDKADTYTRGPLAAIERGERSCADCLAYAPVSQMITKQDGRVICQACQKAIQDKARDKAQPDLFITQFGLF